ncbi:MULTISPECIES: GUN4 domain-containing protein [unclassified Dolichospermum]|jgi:hypothetical protein|uniref:GUN4 domain-containing protein n=1 Tax=unclassified Dolichospermum TaxID=2622029 RepID=UPI0014451BDE|nr:MULTISPECIES: GUN4 domain-containing protein [unclassified Dolichospermum]MCX5981117.1 GUN4 domain-containing protein [Nostocales cyanobacterium LacPavin_0920_SED1_MAG_38_18]MTJ16894.1 GUN4 domain-containing protein [Dolichospermum sp. UHCC 0299]MTJ41053.1 GUN4 domain-containing protein [Dolichospermum sp. UHCC 0406]
MSKERLEQLLRELEEAKITNYGKIASFQKKLAYISNAPQEFELNQEIKLAEKKIQDIDIQIESLRKEIGDMEERLRSRIVIPPLPLPPPIGSSTILIDRITGDNLTSPKKEEKFEKKDELDHEIEDGRNPYPLYSEANNHINLRGNYDKLSHLLLKKKEWKAADVETMQVMLQIAKKTKEGWLTSKDILNIPSEDLRKIDCLWLEASNQKFGYSVQKNIWLKIQAESKNFDISINYNPSLFLKFADQVGWRVNNNLLMNYDEFDFSLNAPDGHLPTFRFPSSTEKLGKWRDSLQFFLPRL